MIEGKLQRVIETAKPPHLQLEGHKLNAGHALDVLIGKCWIEGRIEYDRIEGWYLATDGDTDPLIVLHTGVMARIDESW
jgi:Domain of unknown function (DUF5348)